MGVSNQIAFTRQPSVSRSMNGLLFDRSWIFLMCSLLGLCASWFVIIHQSHYRKCPYPSPPITITFWICIIPHSAPSTPEWRHEKSVFHSMLSTLYLSRWRWRLSVFQSHCFCAPHGGLPAACRDVGRCCVPMLALSMPTKLSVAINGSQRMCAAFSMRLTKCLRSHHTAGSYHSHFLSFCECIDSETCGFG